MAGSSRRVSPPDTASGGSRRRHGRKAHARGAHCPSPPKAAAGHLRYAARRAAARPLCVWSRAQGARSMRAPPVAVPRPQGAGARQTRPPAPVAQGRCGASPRVCLGSSAAWGASRRPAPTCGGTFGGAGAQRPHFAAPHAVVGALRVAVFSQLPPAPRPLGRGEREVTTACGRGRGLLTSARVLLQGRPLRLATRTRSAYKGNRASAPRYISPLDKLPRYLVRYPCEVTPAAFAALPSTSMVRQSPPSKTGGFCYI